MKIKKSVKRFFQEEFAVTTTEYAVMLALIVLIAFKSMQLAGFEISGLYNDSADVLGTHLDN